MEFIYLGKYFFNEFCYKNVFSAASNNESVSGANVDLTVLFILLDA